MILNLDEFYWYKTEGKVQEIWEPEWFPAMEGLSKPNTVFQKRKIHSFPQTSPYRNFAKTLKNNPLFRHAPSLPWSLTWIQTKRVGLIVTWAQFPPWPYKCWRTKCEILKRFDNYQTSAMLHSYLCFPVSTLSYYHNSWRNPHWCMICLKYYPNSQNGWLQGKKTKLKKGWCLG